MVVVAGAELALLRLAKADVIDKLKNAEALLRSDQKTLTRLILWPLRFMYTARTGDVGRNDGLAGPCPLRAAAPPAGIKPARPLKWLRPGKFCRRR